MFLPVILAAIIGTAHFLSDKFYFSKDKHRAAAASFVAGVSVIYIFMKLYPQFYKAVEYHSPFMLSAVLIGFSSFFLIDKLIYQNIEHHKVTEDVRLAHGYGLIVYYLVVGVALVRLSLQNPRDGILFFLPVLIYASLSGMSSHGIHGIHGPRYKTITHIHILQSFAILAGAQFALMVALPASLTLYMLGFVAGVMTYIVVRDILPRGKQGRPTFFVIGALSYMLLLVSIWPS